MSFGNSLQRNCFFINIKERCDDGNDYRIVYGYAEFVPFV